MTVTKFGCGMALCGACTVHVHGQPVRSCITQVSTVVGKPITKIGAMASDDVGKRVQRRGWSSAYQGIRARQD